MDERTHALALGAGTDDLTGEFHVELGTLVAALSAWTEDETELELGLRAFIERGHVFLCAERTSEPTDIVGAGACLAN